jgi:hypothetical protein
MIFSKALAEGLPQSVKSADFQELITRLFAYGVICRSDNAVEKDAYDLAFRVLPLVEDYFFVSGYRLVHVDNLATLLLYPPSSTVPGIPSDHRDLYPGPRQRMSTDTVAIALVLKFLYLEGFNEGRADEDGEIVVTYEAVLTALHTQLRREPPKAESERAAIFKRLRSYRIVRVKFHESGFQPDTLIVIRPLVTWIVSDEFLLGAQNGTPDPQEG